MGFFVPVCVAAAIVPNTGAIPGSITKTQNPMNAARRTSTTIVSLIAVVISGFEYHQNPETDTKLLTPNETT